MEKTLHARVIALVAALPFLMAEAGWAQASKAKPSESKANVPATSKNARLKLEEAARVSTTDVARQAIREKIGAQEKAAGSKKSELEKGGSGVADDDILELRPTAGPTAARAGGKSVKVQEDKHSFLKNVHGSASGGLDPSNSQNRMESGAAGATSKSGKTHVYVETDSANQAPPD